MMKAPQLLIITAVLMLVASAWWMPAVEAGSRLTCTAVAGGGAWNDNSTWTGCSGNGNNGVPTEEDYVEMDGANVVVTIPMGFSAEGYSITVSDRASLSVAGSLNTTSLNVQEAATFSSTGSLNLAASDQLAELYCDGATMTLAHGLSLSNDFDPIVNFNDCEVLIDGSLELTSAVSGVELKVRSMSNVTINGDVILIAGLLSTPLANKRGDSGSASLSVQIAALQVAGDLRITSANLTESLLPITGVEGTRDVFLELYGGLLSVGGDVEVRSGDTFIGTTGQAIISSGYSVFMALSQATFAGITVMMELASSVFAVGGSLTVESGSATGLRDDGNNGYMAGYAVIDLAKTALLVNGSAESSITVRGGHAGNSTTNGGSFSSDRSSGPQASTTQFSMGLDSVVAVAKDVLVQSGNGGDANVTAGNDDGWYGGNAKPALFALIGSVDAVIGGNLIVLGGHGGNSNDQSGMGGDGGLALGYFGLGGSLTVGGDILIASGSAGKGMIGGQANHAAFYVGTNVMPLFIAIGDSGSSPELNNAQRGDVPIPFEGIPIAMPGTGKLDMRVGGSVTIAGGMASSSNYSGYQGGQCNDAILVLAQTETSGGFIVENAWEGNVVIGGDVIIESCTPGGSVDGNGQDTGSNMFLVAHGGSVSVGGSVSIMSANGSSVTGGSSDAGDGGSSLVWVVGHSTLDIAGSVTLANGNGGDVVDGTGSPGEGFSDGYAPMLLVLSNAHMTVGGDIALTGGNGGNVDAAMTDGSSSNGGTPLVVTAAVLDVSSLTVGGNMALLCGVMGNSSTNYSNSDILLLRQERQEQKERKMPVSEHTARLLRDRHEANDNEPAKRGGYFDNDETTVEVYGYSKLHVTGDLTLGHNARQVNNLNEPNNGYQASLEAHSGSSVTIEGDVTIAGGSGGILSSNATFSLGWGGMALIEIRSLSTLKLGGNVVLVGGDAAQDANGFTGIQGVAGVYLSRGEIHQSGRFSLVDGQGQSMDTGEVTVGITMWQSEWTVYPCPGAGLQTAEGRNGSFFLVEAQSSFRDCRSASARQADEAEPLVDVTSCWPCSCSEAPFNSCPEFSSGSRGAESAVMACVQALLTHLLALW